MKKFAGIIGGIALMLCVSGCSWQMPEKVSVKTQAEYNFSLGNFEKDFSEELSVNKLLKDVELPNNGKIYDYWPDKKDKTQRFLMYMPLQEIPIDISKYFDKGSLADAIKNISFEKEIEVPKIDFEFSVDVDLDSVNEQISQNFRLAGMVKDYNASEFGSILSEFASYLSYEKGILVVKAFAIDPTTLMSGGIPSSVDDLIGNSPSPDPDYSGSITLRSNGKSITGTFNNGVAEINIGANGGFDFKADDINISFSDKQTVYNPLKGEDIPTRAFIATIDTTDKTNRPYQIKSVNGLQMATAIPFSDTEEINTLSSIENFDGCTIGEGSIDLNFGIPQEWTGVNVSYYMSLTGGVNLNAGAVNEPVNSKTDNPHSIDLAGKTITPSKITADVNCLITIDKATIDFTKKPTIGFKSNIKKISAVTVKLSDTSLSFDEKQELPDTVLDIVKRIALNECGIKGTYTNTLPAGNNISLAVFSNFFNIHDPDSPSNGKGFTLESNVKDKPLELLSEPAESGNARVVKLSKNPASDDEYKEFDFKIDVNLPGSASDKITVQNVEPNKKYKFAINLEPVINWEYVIVNMDALPSDASKALKDTIGTGFNPSSIFSSINDMLGEDFAEKIKLPECKLHVYLTKPEGVGILDKLNLEGSTIKMFYGTTPDENAADKTPQKIGDYENVLLEDGKVDGKDIKFVNAPVIEAVKDAAGNEVVTSNATPTASITINMGQLIESTEESKTEGAQLCVDYNIQIGGVHNTDGDPIVDENGQPINGIKIEQSDLDTSVSGSIGIYVVIDLPLSFEMNGDTNIDLTKLMNKKDESSENSASSSTETEEKKDLFGRTEASGMDEIKQYIEAVKSVSLSYEPIAFPIDSTQEINIDIAFKENGTREVYKERFNIDTGRGDTLNLEVSKFEEMLDAYPLQLEANINLKNGTKISIPREKKIDVNLGISLETDGEIPLLK